MLTLSSTHCYFVSIVLPEYGALRHPNIDRSTFDQTGGDPLVRVTSDQRVTSRGRKLHALSRNPLRRIVSPAYARKNT